MESSTSALLGVPEVEGQKQEDSEEERCAVGSAVPFLHALFAYIRV